MSWFHGIKIFIVIFAIFIILLSSRFNSNRKHGLVHMWFALQATFMCVTIIIALFWFVKGKEFFIDYGDIWCIVERGTLKSLSSVVGVIGVGSILLGWAYGERDNITLGKAQIDIIHYLYGTGYSLSIIVHFIATALCMILIECQAKEASLWAFCTVVSGCIPQAAICLRVAFNRKNREKIALKLWRKESGVNNEIINFIFPTIYKMSFFPSIIKSFILEKCLRQKKEDALNDVKIDTIIGMAKFLSDFDVLHHPEYLELIAQIIVEWSENNYNIEEVACGATMDRIQKLSSVFRELFERIPNDEYSLWEEELLKQACKNMTDNDDKSNFASNLLAASYLHFLYCKSKEETNFRINKIMYYSKHQEGLYKNFCNLVKSFYYGIEWYRFLDQCAELPTPILCENINEHYIDQVFEQMVSAIYYKDGLDVVERASIAWSQV